MRAPLQAATREVVARRDGGWKTEASSTVASTTYAASCTPSRLRVHGEVAPEVYRAREARVLLQDVEERRDGGFSFRDERLDDRIVRQASATPPGCPCWRALTWSSAATRAATRAGVESVATRSPRRTPGRGAVARRSWSARSDREIVRGTRSAGTSSSARSGRTWSWRERRAPPPPTPRERGEGPRALARDRVVAPHVRRGPARSWKRAQSHSVARYPYGVLGGPCKGRRSSPHTFRRGRRPGRRVQEERHLGEAHGRPPTRRPPRRCSGTGGTPSCCGAPSRAPRRSAPTRALHVLREVRRAADFVHPVHEGRSTRRRTDRPRRPTRASPRAGRHRPTRCPR